MDILTALRMGVDYRFTIKLRQLELMVRPLSMSERVAMVNDVTQEISTKPKASQNSLTESSLLAIRTLELATTPEPGSKVAPTLPAAISQQMTSDELSAMYGAYQAGCDILDPAAEQLTTEKLTLLVDEAKKNLSGLTGLPPALLVQLVRYLLTSAGPQEASTSGG
jgi:hypothetical protein